MNNQEAVQLVAIVKALCPTQPLESMTPDAWALVLDDIRYDDAQQAVRTLYRDRGNDQEWGGRKIEADDIVREVRRIRQDRIRRHPPIDPPHEMTPIEYQHWLLTTRRAIADGDTIPQPALPRRDMRTLAALGTQLNSED